ncbi:uncharacterized protein [Ptychodera flava]|uniref:uncharacterized protein isoform X2 n=1 Tax=Ptychodera flava TaxID=63121 RepID=UPI00396A46EB
MSVRTIYEQAELNDIKNNIGDRVLVLMIAAWWHERSEDFIPTYKAFAREFRALNFIKTDIAAAPLSICRYTACRKDKEVATKKGKTYKNTSFSILSAFL